MATASPDHRDDSVIDSGDFTETASISGPLTRDDDLVAPRLGSRGRTERMALERSGGEASNKRTS
jgi:hypothetical protein